MLDQALNDRIVVVGAGVAALCAARHLQLAGRQVALIDPQPVDGGASFGNGGFISAQSFMPGAQPGMVRKVPRWLSDPVGPLTIRTSRLLPEMPWFFRWLRASRRAEVYRLAERLHRLHRDSFEWWGHLLGPDLYAKLIQREGEIALFDDDPASNGKTIEECLGKRLGLKVAPVGRSELERIYPGLSPIVKGGLMKPGNGHTLSPARLCKALAELLMRDGAHFIPEKVVKLVRNDSGWLILTNSNNHRARDVVLAAGVWSASLLAPLGIRVPLTSQRGYHAMLPRDALALGKPFIHRARGIGMTPMLEGLRIAGTVEFAGIDGAPDERRAAAIVCQARRLFPALEPHDVKIWSGQRPATPDSLPILGPVPDMPGLWLCFGSGAYGMTQSPAAGRLVSDLILGRPPVLDPADYGVDRFSRPSRVRNGADPENLTARASRQAIRTP